MDGQSGQAPIMAEPLLSGVLPNFNHTRYLSRAIDAIAAQDRSAEEIIVIDDASTDDSRGALARCRERYPGLVVLCNPGIGRRSAIKICAATSLSTAASVIVISG